MTILIVGGDSRIGRDLADDLRRQGRAVLASTRHPDRAGPDRPLLDLADPPAGWTPPAGLHAAILCAAQTSQQTCQDDPEASRRINVTGTLEIGEALARAGIFTVFLSTNLVFDGSRPALPADTAYHPTGVYGAQKAEAEQGLRRVFPPDRLAIVRLSKVLAPDAPLLLGWRAALDEGRSIHPFDDVLIAPISLVFACRALARIAGAAIGGIFQVSSADEISYADMALSLAGRWTLDRSLVLPVKGRDSNPVMRAAPAHGSLDASRLADLLGLSPPSAAAIVDDIA